jgi:hypothetical protein
VRSPLRLVALTAGLAMAASLLPVDAAAQGRRGNRAPAVRSARPVHARPAVRPRVVVRPYRYNYYRPYYRYGYRSYPYWWGGYGWAPYGYWSPFWGSYYGWGYPYYWGGYYYRHYDPNDRLGAARLQVTPRETEVFVDGYFAGVVDDFDGFSQRLRLEPGEHEITLFLDGHRPLTRKMRFTVGQTFKIQHEMEPIAAGDPPPQRPVPVARPATPPQGPAAGPGRGYGRPGMRMPRRGDPAEAEPVERPEDEGPIVEPEARPRRLPPPDERGERGERGGLSGTLAIRVQPDDAEVFVDGESWARTGGERLNIALAPGVHRLEVRKAGHETYVGLVRIRPGVATTLNVALATVDGK